jgi:uncharacterized protein
MRAIDMHVHPGTREYLVDAGGKLISDALSYFHRHDAIVSMEEMVAYYRRLDMMAVLLAWDAETATGLPPVSNDYVAEAVRNYPDVFIGFASVDPWKGRLAVAELERAVKELGLKGLKLHPIVQAFFLNDRRFYPLWETCSALKIPLLIHTGTTGVGAGVPGGNGLKLKYAQPIPYIDDIAADFPENTLLQDRVLFGSDYPFLKPERWIADFEKVGFKPEIWNKILLENAKGLLGL